VRSIGGNDHLMMICTTANELRIMRDGSAERTTRCAANSSAQPLVVAGPHYAALLDSERLLLVRNGQALELPTHIAGAYELALSSTGLLAVADLSDKTWFVRPGGSQLELGPAHASLPTIAAVDDHFVAWGYADGVVIAISTKTAAVWRFKGHSDRISGLIIDADRARLVSVAGGEVRIWALTPNVLTEVSQVPCTVYNLALSPDQTRTAMDCLDGGLRIWTFATGVVEQLHRHRGLSYSVAWWRNKACSAGFDQQVLCSSLDGNTQTILSSPVHVQWITTNPDRQNLVIATEDGKIQEFGDVLKTLYTHRAAPYRVAFRPDGQMLASGAVDGSVIVYDVTQHRDITVNAHNGRVLSVVWQDDDLWTSGADGTMTRWQYQHGSLTPVARIREAGLFRFVHPFKNGWTGNVDSHILLIALSTDSSVLRLDLGRHVTQLEMSMDQRYIAAAVAGEVVVIDLLQNSVATLAVEFDGIGYAGFAKPGLLAISSINGLYSVSLHELKYFPF
jgi:hypothetical protein